jgi:peptide deformylase
MPIRDILKMGDARLLRIAQPWPVDAQGTPVLNAALLSLVADLQDTMIAAHGAGIAAPQIGEDWQVLIFGTGQVVPRYPHAPPIPRTVLINPTLEPLGSATEEGWEGCLSVPGLRGVVARPSQLRYSGFELTAAGQIAPINRSAEGFHARVVQHEHDHLIGTLYPMRVTDFTRFGFTEILFPELTAQDDD